MTKTNAKHKVVWNEKVVTAIYSNQNYKRKKKQHKWLQCKWKRANKRKNKINQQIFKMNTSDCVRMRDGLWTSAPLNADNSQLVSYVAHIESRSPSLSLSRWLNLSLSLTKCLALNLNWAKHYPRIAHIYLFFCTILWTVHIFTHTRSIWLPSFVSVTHSSFHPEQ